MTTRETIDIISESALWEMLSTREKAEAITYAVQTVGCKIEQLKDGITTPDISDVIGEIYSG